MNDNLLLLFLDLLNETLTAGIVIIAASLLLYNFTRNRNNRVARTSAIVLATVTIVYFWEALITLDPSRQLHAAALRLQWIGIALIPAALIHLSDALLATTGLHSRGRRRRIIRILYLISIAFLVMAAFTDVLVQPVVGSTPPGMRAASIFPLYVIYFVLASAVAFVNVHRARLRCLTTGTRRRMTYLQIAMLTPAIGVFPYSVLLEPGEEFSIAALILLNLANILVILMLLFLAYPLSFFGSNRPDRVVKAELLRMMLQGPATALLALIVITFVTPTTRILGLGSAEFIPFAVVGIILLWQWMISLSIPWLEKWLIYYDEDDSQLAKLQSLSQRLLTRNDLLQLIAALLETTCDYLRVNTAFIAAITDKDVELIKIIGDAEQVEHDIEANVTSAITPLYETDPEAPTTHLWESYWVVPLWSSRIGGDNGRHTLIGFMGIEAQSDQLELADDEEHTFYRYVNRAARTLDDMLLQQEVYAALEGLLPQINIDRSQAQELEYKQGHSAPSSLINHNLDREQVWEQVRAALRHYWGGPGLTKSRLLELQIVEEICQRDGDTPVHALRTLLNDAIETQRPAGERKMTSPEWTLYNISHLRFVEKKKVRDVARRLAMSEPDLYRKQRAAIDSVTDTIMLMEEEALQRNPTGD